MAIRFEATEVVDAPPERIFDALLDLDSAHRWMPGLVRMEPLSGGPLAVGSEWRETRKMFGREASEQFRLTAMERPRILEMKVDGTKGSSGRGEFVFRFRIEPVEKGTEVRLSGEIEGLSGVASFFGKLFVGTYRKACAKDLVALKEHLEGEQGE
jgi:carbon monoxide dehydrogenase subunit G